MTTAGNIPLFDRRQVFRAGARAAQSGHDRFLYNHVMNDIRNRLRDIKRDFSNQVLIERDCFSNDEELIGAENACDLALSPLALHTINDLPGMLIQIRRSLKPDGLFIGSLFGGDTLHELRNCLMEAEMNISGGISPRVAPMAGRKDLADLMQRAGFSLPVIDADTLTVTYGDIFRLMNDLRGMGETNALSARRRNFTPRALFMEAGRIYREKFGDSGGRIPATFEIITLTGWAPHESQQKPLRRGSAEHSLADALEC